MKKTEYICIIKSNYDMLNRRILRIKAFKVLYSFAENPSMSVAEAEAQLEISCESARSLYLLMLLMIPTLTDEASARIEDARNKFNPTDEERNPNMKFVENGLAPLFRDDPDFTKLVSRRKLSWDQYDALVRNLYSTLVTRDYYREYMASPERSLREDVNLFVKIFEQEFVDNTHLASILEDMSIWWNDDLAYSLTCCCDTLKDLASGKSWSLPPLYRSEMSSRLDVESDKAFIYKLLRQSYACFDKYSRLVAENVSQWESDRLFTTDMVLIVMGLSEAKAFPDMPVRVTINEYVEISKYYSTPKSRSFVNGLLDRLIRKLVSEGDIVKTAPVI